VTQAYADEIKADGYASDAPGAVALCKGMLA
jgi:methanogenic corrinoid protein MtbC1